MRYLELFAGAGGLSMGLEAAGMTPLAHAEIEPHARAVLRYRWPTCRLDGDVREVRGADFRGCDVVAGGSPCQDLSVAGKRAGLGGARSGLFHEQARLWDETGAPYLIWENVVGALSSQNGRDFALVLSTLVGSPVAVPRDGWPSAGVVAGRTGVAAWRVLDLQHFGPPQRRRRVFVVAARAGGCDPAEVLALTESLCGHPAPRDGTREGVTGTLAARTRVGGGLGTDMDLSGGIVAFNVKQDDSDAAEIAPTLLAMPHHESHANGGGQLGVVAVDTYNQAVSPHVFHALRTGGLGDSVPAVLAFHHTQDPISGDVAPALGVTTHAMGVLSVLGDVTHALTHEGHDASEDGTGRGTPIVAPTLNMGAHTAAPGSNGQDAAEWAEITVGLYGRPRRLTPLECERLMGWPDHWTARGIDEQGREYALSDSARYKLCGNGVGAPVAAWIGRQLMAHHAALRPERAARRCSRPRSTSEVDASVGGPA